MKLTFFSLAVAAVLGLADAALVRICVPESGMGHCQDMLREPALASLNLQCVSGPDRYGCLEKVMKKAADTVAVSGEDVFLARELYDTNLQVVAEMRTREQANEAWRYQGMAVVRRSTIRNLQDLQGAKSCHTGYARTAGWNIPFSHLLDKGLISMQCEAEATVVEHDVKAAAAFFGDSCIPGNWAPDNATNFMLKQKYKSLCAGCGVPEVCDAQDPHAGYQGALSCLVDGGADVAWTKMSAVREFFKARSEVAQSEYGLLCSDGRVLELRTSAKDCRWASRPWNGWVARAANENKKGIQAALAAIVATAAPPQEVSARAWGKPVLGVSKPSVLHPRSPPVTTRDYLKEHKYDTTIDRLGCPETPIKLCVDSSITLEKCQALREVLRSRRIRPALSCVTPSSGDCLKMVATQGAHITTADGGDVYRAFVEYGMMPVVSERYGLQDASYFAVAVVRADSGITALSQLRGKKSCHTGIGRTAGWKVPVVSLLNAGLLEKGNCDFAQQIGDFFSSSCVPGAKNPTYDPEGTNPQSLCALCIGNNVNGGATGPVEGRCDRRPIEAFSGYTGAFRCLVQGGGDVAFVKHTTVRDNTNGNNNASWTANLRATDFKLLCLNTGTADVVDYKTCHLARVPAHKVLIDPNLSEVMKEEARIMLLRASDRFPKGQDVFNMFGSFKGKADLIFKDSATELANVRMDFFHTSLKDNYYKTLSEMDVCKEGTNPLPFKDDAADNAATPLHTPTTHLLMGGALAWLLAR